MKIVLNHKQVSVRRINNATVLMIKSEYVVCIYPECYFLDLVLSKRTDAEIRRIIDGKGKKTRRQYDSFINACLQKKFFINEEDIS